MKLEYEALHLFDNKLSLFGAHHNLLENTTFTYNWHEQIELLYVEDGEGEIILNYLPLKAIKGDIFVVNSNQIHTISSNTSMTVFSIIVSNDFFSQIGISSLKVFIETEIHDDVAVRYFEYFIKEFSLNDSFRNNALLSSLSLLVLYLLEHHSAHDFISKPSHTIIKIQTGLNYMRKHLTEDITGDVVAKELGISKCHFLREFKKLTNCTFSDFLNKLRCTYACDLLSKEDVLLSEIALQCGYENFSYFSRTFKKIIGISPMQYRKQLVPKNKR